MKYFDAINNIFNLEKRNSDFLHLTINENQMSKTARLFAGSKLSERYYFGGGTDGMVDFGNFTFVGLPELESLVKEAERVLMRLSGGEAVNLNCLSGIHAMTCAILTTTEPGDLILTLEQKNGGHFATKGVLERVGRRHEYLPFNLERLEFDIERLRKLCIKKNPRAIYLDVSNHLNPHNLRDIREVVGNKVLIIYDASHTLGLILGGQFQDPFAEGADVICANTHKTFAGPQKGIIAFKDKILGDQANLMMAKYLYSSVHLNDLIPLAITILEWEEYGKAYAKEVISNSHYLGKALDDLGLELRRSNRGNYTENEQLHIYVDKLGDRRQLFQNLVNSNISVNFQNVMGGREFARIGSQEITRRGMNKGEMGIIATLFDRALKGEDVAHEVSSFTNRFKSIHYSFDNLIHKFNTHDPN